MMLKPLSYVWLHISLTWLSNLYLALAWDPFRIGVHNTLNKDALAWWLNAVNVKYWSLKTCRYECPKLSWGQNNDSAQYLHRLLTGQPDLSLEEIQENIVNNCNKYISRLGLWKSLTQGGYTMKKVCIFLNFFFLLRNIALYYISSVTA